MSITWHCECGKCGKVPDDKAGKKGKCPACGRVIQVPLPEPAEDSDTFELAEPEAPVKRPARGVPTMPPGFVPPPLPPGIKPVSTRSAGARPAKVSAGAASTVQNPSLTEKSVSGKRRGAKDYLYLLMLLALIPLGISLFRSGHGDDVERRLKQMMEKNPEIAVKVQEVMESDEAGSEEKLFQLLPGHRIEGSLLARDTWWHWAFALLSASAFMGLMILMFPPGHAARTHLIWTGVFTATAGIIVLIAFQFVANWTQGWWVRGRGIAVLLFYVVKFIGFSYRCAEDPNNSFLLSFIGFTLGVGLCEELIKALPLLWHFSTYGTLGWRAACLWGFASGVGFGVAEGIMYSSRYYNGIGGGEIYVVRFVSCVALHAVWSASVGIFLWKHQGLMNDAEGFFGVLVNGMVVVAMPMVLHGAYDTLLKKDMNTWALAVAGVSFAWLVYQIESARRADPDDAEVAEEEDEGRVVYTAPM